MQQRQTIQKQVIMETLDKLKHVKGHLSIDEIYNAVRTEYASISKTTIYRNVRHLAESGAIAQVILEDGIERYDVNIHDHHHFTCRLCKTIYDIEIEGLLDFSQCLDDNYQFATETVNLSFIGICKTCKSKKQ
ncbi:MAG: transcriptional repressor [Defluviitaleaceae bacterium]|nr:transcriptional repressor [Defluviitaleaceae bacterium]